MSLQNKTVEDWSTEGKHDSTYGMFSYDNFKRMQLATVLSGFEPLAEDEIGCTVVDVSARDASCFHRVTAALRLPPGPQVPDLEMLAAL